MKRLLSILMVMIITLTLANTVSRAVDEKISLDKCKISFSKKTFTYTGEGIIPVVKVTYKKKKLKKDKDYNIYYKDNVSVGTATVTLVGLGNYTGSTSATFTITKGKQTIKAKNIKATYGDENVTVNAVADNPMTYKSSNKKVITVNPVGIITIKKAGKATITIKAEGSGNVKPAKKVIKVTIAKAKPEVTAFGGIVALGKMWDLHASTTSPGKLTYSSSNKKVASVSKKGIVKGLKVGKATITVKCGGTKNYKPASTKVTIEVSDSLG